MGAWIVKAKYTHGSLVIVRDEDDRLLLVKQRLGERHRWALPSGFMNPKESPAQAAIRELSEETGIQLAPIELELINEYKQPWAMHYEHLYRATSPKVIPNPKPVSLEISKIEWFNMDDLPPLARAADLALEYERGFLGE